MYKKRYLLAPPSRLEKGLIRLSSQRCRTFPSVYHTIVVLSSLDRFRNRTQRLSPYLFHIVLSNIITNVKKGKELGKNPPSYTDKGYRAIGKEYFRKKK